jgi:hypothetical protein
MECSCNIEIDDYDSPSFFDETIIKRATRQHKCTECKRLIEKNERYSRIVGVWSSKFEVYKTCVDCMSVRSEFFDSGFPLGAMWNEVTEYIYNCEGAIPEACLTQLTNSARERVLKIMEEYHQDDDFDDD